MEEGFDPFGEAGRPDTREVILGSASDASQTDQTGGKDDLVGNQVAPQPLESYTGRYASIVREHMQHAEQAMLQIVQRREAQDESEHRDRESQTQSLQLQLSDALTEANQQRRETEAARQETQRVREQLDESRLMSLDRARQAEEMARERDEAEQLAADRLEDIKTHQERLQEYACNGDGRQRQLEQEKAQRKKLEGENVSLRTELSGLRSQPVHQHQQPQPLVLDPRLAAETVAVIDMAEQALVSRVAEAIRRSRVEMEALAAGVRAETYRRAAVATSCPCVATAEANLRAAALPEPAGTSLNRTVQVVMMEMQDGSLADLAGHPFGVYQFSDQADRATVAEAIQEGWGNLATSSILRDSSCRFARRVTGDQVAERCPILTAAALAGIARIEAIVPTAPMEVVLPVTPVAEASGTTSNVAATESGQFDPAGADETITGPAMQPDPVVPPTPEQTADEPPPSESPTPTPTEGELPQLGSEVLAGLMQIPEGEDGL